MESYLSQLAKEANYSDFTGVLRKAASVNTVFYFLINNPTTYAENLHDHDLLWIQ